MHKYNGILQTHATLKHNKMADKPCKECLRLWKAYRYAMRASYRIDKRLKDALAVDNPGTFQQLSEELSIAEALRGGTRTAIREHQKHHGK